jgi:uncharacterized protein YutE (UPF0331/DUF86 family)
MVDAERLHRVARRITDDVVRLRRHAQTPADELRRDDVRLGDVKYRFVTAIEGCIDAAQHVCASEGYGPPDSNADAVRLLGVHDVVDQGLATAIASAVGFRNVLVHGYADVDDRQVVAMLDRLGDFDAYVTALSRLL